MYEFIGSGIMNIKSYFSPAHIHYDKCEILYYIEGSGKLIAGEKIINFKEGDIIYIPSAVVHSEKSKKGFRNIYCSVRQIEILGDDILVFHDNYDREYKHIMLYIMNNFFLQKPGYQEIVSALIDVLIKYMLSWKEKNPINYYVDMCERKIIANIYNCDFSVNEIINDTPLSKTHFIRLFKKETGYTPQKYLLEKRINNAIELLINQSLKLRVKETAFMCGYRNQYHFSKVFKRKTGLSPEQYKNNKGQKRKEIKDSCQL